MSDSRVVGVVGAGSWGTTLAVLLAGNGHEVRLWARRPEHADEMQRTRKNPRYVPGIAIPDGVNVTSSLPEAVSGAAMCVMAVPTHTMREVAGAARSAMERDVLVVNTSKGLEEGTLERMSEVLTEATGVAPARVLSLMGPSHAEEVCREIPTSVVVAGEDLELAEVVQTTFSRPYFRVYTNEDVVGVEIATALKNAIAIAAGIIDGLGYGDNTKAALVTRGLAEIGRLGSAMGAKPATFSGLAGVGDLVVTCLSRHSRNRHVGEAIGRGETLQEALASMAMVAEGVRTTRAAVELGRRHSVELPIIEMVHDVLFDGRNPREAVGQLMTRPLRQEMPDDRPGESERS
jgi:glycerol-3-phosphate dehydrogenase (NAD(P)+)